MRAVRGVVEGVVVILAMLIIPLIPRRIIVWMARGMGSAGFVVARRDRRRALANLDLAYGDTLPAKEKQEIARRSFQGFALVALDWFWFGMHTEKRLRKCVDLDPSVELLKDGGPRIFVTAHFGNWEIMGRASPMFGFPLTSIARPQPNAVITWVINRIRSSTGQELVSTEGALQSMVKTLRQGRPVAMLLDQDTDPELGGVFVDFFGVPVSISKGAALLAMRLECSVVPIFCVPRGSGRYFVRASPALLPASGGEDVVSFTAKIAKEIESQIRAVPGAWLWMYKRWKRIPQGSDPARFPFYAKPQTGRIERQAAVVGKESSGDSPGRSTASGD